LLFCNWPSRKEGRTPCDERSAKNEKSRDYPSQATARDARRVIATSNGYRLPTEAEWEYHRRAVTAMEFASGSDQAMVRKYAIFQASATATCGSKPPNCWGVFDMHGNVWQWCWDGSGNDDVQSPVFDPRGTPGARAREVRGADWVDTADSAKASNRYRLTAEDRYNFLGFRVARGAGEGPGGLRSSIAPH
jgi:formylglycine-generating enzyme required for sulfatase activity